MSYDTLSTYNGHGEQSAIDLHLPADVYYRPELGVASKSGLDQVARSPAHYRAWLDGQRSKDSPALAVGRAMHVAVLEPSEFDRTYAVEPTWPDLRLKENKHVKAERDAWRVANAGKQQLSADDAAMIAGVRASIAAHPLASRLFEDGHSEVSIRYTDADTGIVCKSRLDYWVPSLGLVNDLKSTENAHPDDYARSVARYGYHRQHAFYVDGLRACGADVEHFIFVAVEKSAPYAISVFELDAAAVELGRRSIRRDLQMLAECLERDEWPSYSQDVVTLSLPRWAA